MYDCCKLLIHYSSLRRTEEQKQAEGTELFDFCAECLGRFVQDHYGDEDGNVDLKEDLPLGFTFSYPCE